MFDAALLPVQKRLLQPPAAWLAARGISADQITLSGFCLGVAASVCVALGAYGAALALILLNRLCDGLDGAVARINGPTRRGAFLDIALDFVFYALVPLGFAIADPAANALAAAALLAAFVGTGSSFLAFSVIAAQEGRSAADYPTKGIYYIGGLTEGFETIVFFVLLCLFPDWFDTLGFLFAGACLLTTVSRWFEGWKAFGDASVPEPNPKD
jgi:phosphatidylglycerophosphate synthase